MNKFIYCIFCLYFCINIVQAQNTLQTSKIDDDDSYSRSSLSFLLLDFNDKYAQYLKQNINRIQAPAKFDYNDIATKYIPANCVHNMASSKKTKQILTTLRNINYANQIMRYWWQVQDDGSYSVDLIKQRGIYNATDEDVYQADASKRGRSRLADGGLKLLNNNYVLVLEYDNLQTMKDEYDKIDRRNKKYAEKTSTNFEPVERTKNGFKAKLTAYLFKLNYSDTIQGYLDNSFINDNKIDVNKFDKIFSHIYAPYKLISTETLDADGTQYNPGQSLAPNRQLTKNELIVKLLNTSVDKAMDKIETSVASFKVKANVTSINPVKAKIGIKEGVKYERRFIVYEYVANRKNEVVAKRKATIRASKVKDNRNDELGHTQESEFYQIGGGTIEEGMTLKESKDMGIGIGLGYSNLGFNIHADANIGQLANLQLKQVKIYGNAIIGKSDYTGVDSVANSTMPTEGGYTEIKWAIGILKEHPFMKGNLRAGGYLGYSNEIMLWTADETTNNNSANSSNTSASENLISEGINWGVHLGVNLFSPSIHLIGSVGGYHYFKTTYNNSESSSDEGVELDKSVNSIFPNKQSLNFGVLLRVSF